MIRKLIKKIKDKNRFNNQGFTLVELLVAIAVLALVVFPTMEVFIAATKTNSNARTELQATITANSVLESSKAFSIYSYYKQCNKTYDGSGSDGFDLIAGRKVGGSIVNFTDSTNYGGTAGVISYDSASKKVTSCTASNSNTFTEKAGVYYFALNGIMQSNQKFDAVVIFEKQPVNDVTMNTTGLKGTYTSNKAEQVADSSNASFNFEYNISIIVYKHDSTPMYMGKDIMGIAIPKGKPGHVDDSDAIAIIHGSKLDNAVSTK